MFLHAKTSTFHRSFQTDDIVKNKKNAVTISDNIVVNFLFLFIHLFFLNFSRFLLCLIYQGRHWCLEKKEGSIEYMLFVALKNRKKNEDYDLFWVTFSEYGAYHGILLH